jgi:hypothetical protein
MYPITRSAAIQKAGQNCSRCRIYSEPIVRIFFYLVALMDGATGTAKVSKGTLSISIGIQVVRRDELVNVAQMHVDATA